MDYRGLIEDALEARAHAYCPYSGFAAGAALLGVSGRVYSGCNIENASYSVCNCAERTALFKAVSVGETTFKAIAVVAGDVAHIDEMPNTVAPCGVCLQALSEFDDGDMMVILARSPSDYEVLTLGQLLPHRFGAHDLTT